MFTAIKNSLSFVSKSKPRLNNNEQLLIFNSQEEINERSKESMFISSTRHTENKGFGVYDYTNPLFAREHAVLESKVQHAQYNNQIYPNQFSIENYNADLEVSNTVIKYPVNAYTLMPIRLALSSFDRLIKYRDKHECRQVLISNQLERNKIFYPYYNLVSENSLESIKDSGSKKFSDGLIIQAKTDFFFKIILTKLGFKVSNPIKSGTRADICLNDIYIYWC